MMDTKICSILIKLLAAMIAMLCMAHGLDTEGAWSVESGEELDLYRLKWCSDTELREQLELRFKRHDFIGLHEIMHMEEVYSRCKDEGSDGYFVLIGLMVTSGEWQERYKNALLNANLIMPKDEIIVKEFIHEMVTGKVWTELNKQLAIAVVKKLEENLNNGGQARARNEEPSNVVYHIASHVELWLQSKKRRWEYVMTLLLRKSEITNELVNGKYNKDLVKMFDEGMALKSSFCEDILNFYPELIIELVDNNKVLAKKIMVNIFNDGFWLYSRQFEYLMQQEKIRRFYSEDEAFERMRMDYTASGELLYDRLVALAKEGRLNKLVKQTIKRLIRTSQFGTLRSLVTIFGRRELDELQRSKELNSALRHMAENEIEKGNSSCLRFFLEILGRVEYDRLLDRGDLDMALKKGVETLFLKENIDSLKTLIEVVQPRFDQLLGSGELEPSLRRGLLFVINHGRPETLERLMGYKLVRQYVFNKWKGAEEIDTASKKRGEWICQE